MRQDKHVENVANYSQRAEDRAAVLVDDSYREKPRHCAVRRQLRTAVVTVRPSKRVNSACIHILTRLTARSA